MNKEIKKTSVPGKQEVAKSAAEDCGSASSKIPPVAEELRECDKFPEIKKMLRVPGIDHLMYAVLLKTGEIGFLEVSQHQEFIYEADLSLSVQWRDDPTFNWAYGQNLPRWVAASRDGFPSEFSANGQNVPYWLTRRIEKSILQGAMTFIAELIIERVNPYMPDDEYIDSPAGDAEAVGDVCVAACDVEFCYEGGAGFDELRDAIDKNLHRIHILDDDEVECLRAAHDRYKRLVAE